jgi:hypothetical protein
MALPAIHSRSGGEAYRTAAEGEIGAADSGRPLCLKLLKALDRWRGYVFAAIAAIYLLGFNGQWLIVKVETVRTLS